MLIAITASDVENVWDRVEPLLLKAFRRGDSDYSMQDIKDGLLKRDYQLWVWSEAAEITAACVTCIIVYPRKKICALMMIGGKGLHLWKWQAQNEIIAWAKANGCSALEGYDTRAWIRVLKAFGWRSVWTVIRKDI